MEAFRRAHSPEQREARRAAILATARSMLAEMPAARISLNELSRRAGLAKSNVLRYFESREAILLEICDSTGSEFLAELEDALSTVVDDRATSRVRADQLADAVAVTMARHPIFCDLISAQAAVLEHNISTEAVLHYKRTSIEQFDTLARLVVRAVPELDRDGATRFAATLVMLTGAVWTHAHPPPAVLAAYEADASLSIYRLDFTTTLRDALETTLSGLLARQYLADR
jgi:AcrR family transcriptional regulator